MNKQIPCLLGSEDPHKKGELENGNSRQGWVVSESPGLGRDQGLGQRDELRAKNTKMTVSFGHLGSFPERSLVSKVLRGVGEGFSPCQV